MDSSNFGGINAHGTSNGRSHRQPTRAGLWTRRPKRSPRPASHVHDRPGFEPLEPRVVLAAISWDGGGGDNLWSNPQNWSLNFVPRQIDDVTIVVPNVQRSIIADVPVIRLKSLILDETLIVNSGTTLTTIENFDLTTNADLRINGGVSWIAGTWATTKAVRVNPGGLLNIGSSAFSIVGDVTLNSTIDNAGRLAWRSGNIALGQNGAILNRPAKQMDIASPGSITGEGRVENTGLLRRGGQDNTTTTVTATFISTDRFNILRGGFRVGLDVSAPQARLGGKIALLNTTSALTVNAPAVHSADVQYTGPGSVRFPRGTQSFEGNARLAAKTVKFEGPSAGSEIRIIILNNATLRGAFEAKLSFFEIRAPLRFEGNIDLRDTILSDTGLQSRPLFTIAATTLMANVAIVVDTVVAQGSTLTIGLTTFSTASATVSGGYVLGNSGTTIHNAGTLGIGVNATLRNEVTGRLILKGPLVGGGPNSGPVINLGRLERTNSPTGINNTVITGSLDNRATVEVQQGILAISGSVVQLPAVPTAQDTFLTGGTWRVHSGATLDMPQPIEVIGAQATLDLRGLSNVPDLVGFLRENRGTMLFSGSRPGIFGPGPAIVNKGTMQMDGDFFSLQVFTTPVDQRANGKIIVKNGTLQLHGIAGNTRNFTNPGLIRVENGTLSLDLDEGTQQGTFINTGTLDLRERATLTIDGAMSTTGIVKTQLGNPFRGHVVSTRNLAIGGTLEATYTGLNYPNLFTSVIFVVSSMTVTGSFATFTKINVPSGFSTVLNTMFGVSVRLEQ